MWEASTALRSLPWHDSNATFLRAFSGKKGFYSAYRFLSYNFHFGTHNCSSVGLIKAKQDRSNFFLSGNRLYTVTALFSTLSEITQ